MNMGIQEVLDLVITWATTTGIKVVIALIVLLVSFKVINVVVNKIQKSLEEKQQIDKTLTRALSNAGKIALKILVVVCLIGYLGIETSGISAVIASLGVCAGLAVNGTLANLAGGVMILITRPFSVGDYIEAQGSQGIVEDIHICYTKVLTLDNKVVYLPNAGLSTGTIVNYSCEENRRVDLDFSIFGNDPVLVRGVLLDICEKEELVLADPAPFARLTTFGAGNGTVMQLRAWCKSGDYWTVYHNLLDAAHKAFEERGIVIPFETVNVNIKEK